MSRFDFVLWCVLCVRLKISEFWNIIFWNWTICNWIFWSWIFWNILKSDILKIGILKLEYYEIVILFRILESSVTIVRSGSGCLRRRRRRRRWRSSRRKSKPKEKPKLKVATTTTTKSALNRWSTRINILKFVFLNLLWFRLNKNNCLSYSLL